MGCGVGGVWICVEVQGGRLSFFLYFKKRRRKKERDTLKYKLKLVSYHTSFNDVTDAGTVFSGVRLGFNVPLRTASQRPVPHSLFASIAACRSVTAISHTESCTGACASESGSRTVLIADCAGFLERSSIGAVETGNNDASDVARSRLLLLGRASDSPKGSTELRRFG